MSDLTKVLIALGIGAGVFLAFKASAKGGGTYTGYTAVPGTTGQGGKFTLYVNAAGQIVNAAGDLLGTVSDLADIIKSMKNKGAEYEEETIIAEVDTGTLAGRNEEAGHYPTAYYQGPQYL